MALRWNSSVVIESDFGDLKVRQDAFIGSNRTAKASSFEKDLMTARRPFHVGCAIVPMIKEEYATSPASGQFGAMHRIPIATGV